MAVAPIYAAIRLVRFAITPALAALSGGKGVYWLQAPEGAAFPFVVVQSQDAGGGANPNLGSLGWAGLITVKALAQANGSGNAQAAAESLMEAVAPGMDTLTAPALYDLSVAYVRPVVIPPSDGVWQCAHIWRVSLERE
jgi:hypothetical protein